MPGIIDMQRADPLGVLIVIVGVIIAIIGGVDMFGAKECKSRYWAYRNQGMSDDEAFDEVHRDIVEYYRDTGQVIYHPNEIEAWQNRHQDKINRRYERAVTRRCNRRYKRRQKGRG